MSCSAGAVCAILLAFSAPVTPVTQQVVVVDRSPAAVHAKVLTAAEQLCTKARANDPFGDFGSQDECVDNTLNNLHRRHISVNPALQASR